MVIPTLAEIDVCDDLLEPQIVADPYPYLHMLRTADPVHWNTWWGGWVLTRHADVVLGLSGEYLNPCRHQLPRDVTGDSFAPILARTVRPLLQRVVDQLLDAVTVRGRMDVVGDLALPLPALASAELRAAVLEARGGFGDLSGRDMQEVPALLSGWRQAATDLIANGVLALLRNPCQLERLRAGECAIERSIGELARYDGPVKAVTAVVRTARELDGKTLRAGDRVLLFLAAANRDPARFSDPDRLDLARIDNPHVSFGGGRHHSPAATLASVGAEVAISALLDRFPRLRLDGEPVWRRTLQRRSLRKLQVTC